MTRPAPSDPGSSASLSVIIDSLTSNILDLYTTAEQQLIAQIATTARSGIDAAPFSEARLNMLWRMRQVAQTLASRLQARSTPLAQQLAAQAGQYGQDAAMATLRHLIQSNRTVTGTLLARVASQLDDEPRSIGGHGIASANQIGLDLASKLTAANQRITSFADNAYRAATSEAAVRQVLSLESPATAQRTAWRQLTNRGVSGFTDTSGRNWQLSAYVEMATRTSTQRAYNASHDDRMSAVGIDLFTVPDDGHPCPICQPWQGKVLSNAPDDRADATIAEATEAGLWHPQCKHVLIPFIPGVSKRTVHVAWTDKDQAAYDATVKLRRLEREVRAAKREQVGALNQIDRKRADVHVRQRQAAIRAHVRATGLVRRPRREQLDLGNR